MLTHHMTLYKSINFKIKKAFISMISTISCIDFYKSFMEKPNSIKNFISYTSFIIFHKTKSEMYKTNQLFLECKIKSSFINLPNYWTFQN